MERKGGRSELISDCCFSNFAVVFNGYIDSFKGSIGENNFLCLSGYVKQQGLSESLISILLGAGAVVGVMATVIFPYFRKWMGLQRTGLVSFFLESSCLSVCVVSVFVPGSPFDPYFISSGRSDLPECNVTTNGTTLEANGESLNATIEDSTGCISPSTPASASAISIICLMTGIVTSRLGKKTQKWCSSTDSLYITML